MQQELAHGAVVRRKTAAEERFRYGMPGRNAGTHSERPLQTLRYPQCADAGIYLPG